MKPFRAEHIGSLLRPAALLAARRDFDEGRLSAEALRVREDRFIRDAVALQERVGLEVITDGEYRRIVYFGHFPAAASGFTEMDAARIYREELVDLAVRGATYVQLDDVAFPLLCDTKFREGFRRRGYDPDTMVGRYVSLVNDALRDRPGGVTIGIHLCRGNNQGK